MQGLPWNAAIVVVGASLALVGSLIVVYLKAIKQCLAGMGERLDKQDEKIEKLEAGQQKLGERRAECKDEFVGVGAWVREAGYTRQKLDQAVESMRALQERMDILSQMPQMASQIAAATAKQVLDEVGRQNERTH